jgi:hypothetical protein
MDRRTNGPRKHEKGDLKVKLLRTLETKVAFELCEDCRLEVIVETSRVREKTDDIGSRQEQQSRRFWSVYRTSREEIVKKR